MKRVFGLRNKKDFQMLFRRGRRKESLFFNLISRPNNAGHGRFVFVTPRAVDKRSTVRNRLRRMAREWVRKDASLLNSNLDIAVVFKKGVAACPQSKFYEELKKTTQQIIRG